MYSYLSSRIGLGALVTLLLTLPALAESWSERAGKLSSRELSAGEAVTHHRPSK